METSDRSKSGEGAGGEEVAADGALVKELSGENIGDAYLGEAGEAWCQ